MTAVREEEYHLLMHKFKSFQAAGVSKYYDRRAESQNSAAGYPLLRNGSIKTFPRQRTRTKQWNNRILSDSSSIVGCVSVAENVFLERLRSNGDLILAALVWLSAPIS
jgi:hypothetical protein